LIAALHEIESDGATPPNLVRVRDGQVETLRELPDWPALGPHAFIDSGPGIFTLQGDTLVLDAQFGTRWMIDRVAGADVAPAGEVITAHGLQGLIYYDASGSQRWTSPLVTNFVRMTPNSEVFAWTRTLRTRFSSTGQVLEELTLPEPKSMPVFHGADGTRVDVLDDNTYGSVVRRIDPAGAVSLIDIGRPVINPILSSSGEIVVKIWDAPEVARIDLAGNVTSVRVCEETHDVVRADQTGYITVETHRIARFEWP
jgi:hypothetical protein